MRTQLVQLLRKYFAVVIFYQLGYSMPRTRKQNRLIAPPLRVSFVVSIISMSLIHPVLIFNTWSKTIEYKIPIFSKFEPLFLIRPSSPSPAEATRQKASRLVFFLLTLSTPR